jgi:hypothetical protein
MVGGTNIKIIKGPSKSCGVFFFYLPRWVDRIRVVLRRRPAAGRSPFLAKKKTSGIINFKCTVTISYSITHIVTYAYWGAIKYSIKLISDKLKLILIT